MATDFKTAQPWQFYKQFLQENLRPDGRGLMEFRKTLLNVGSINTAAGSALVRLGQTMVVCGIKAQLAEPTPEQSGQGFFVPNVELSPLCSPEFRPGPPSEKAQVLSQFVLDTVKNSELISLVDLSIVDKKLCWVLYADIVCVSHDGNLTDAVMTSLYAALQNMKQPANQTHITKLPLVRINKDSGVTEVLDDETFEIKLRNKPISTTIAVFDESILLVDPTHEEEQLSSSTVTIVVGNDQQLCSVYKPGGSPVSEELLKTCMQAAFNRRENVARLLLEVNENIDR